MIYVISKSTFGSYNVRDIQCNANWDCCPYSDYALIPDNLVEGILATQGYCDITLNKEKTEVTSFTARAIPSVPEECCAEDIMASTPKTKKGDIISVNDSGDLPLHGMKLYGKTTQNGTPTPDSPVALESTGSSGSITVSVTDGTDANVQTLIAPTPNGLHGIPLGATIPDIIKNSPAHMRGVWYHEADAQYYLSDYKDYTRGVNVRLLVLLENFSKVGTLGVTDYYRYTLGAPLIGNEANVAMCTVTSTYGYHTNDTVHYYVHQAYGGVNVYVPTGFDNSGNVIKVLAALAEPVETPLSADPVYDNPFDCDNHKTSLPWNASASSYYKTTLPSEGNYYLTEDVNLAFTHEIAAGKTLNLCLNGKTLSSTNRVFSVYGVLNISDCDGKGTVKGNTGDKATYGGVFYAFPGATLNIYGGNLQGNSSATLVKNGGVGYVEKSVLNLYGGTISGGTATNYGGNIYLASDSKLNMLGGTISGGNARSGGNVVSNNRSIFNLYGGTISGGTATIDGGNIRVGDAASVVMTGGTVTGGAAAEGGNIYGHSKAAITISGGTVTGDIISSNLYLPKGQTLTLDQLAQFASLRSYKPNTTVTNDSSAEMEVSYYTPNAAVPMNLGAGASGKVLSVDEHGRVVPKAVDAESLGVLPSVSFYDIGHSLNFDIRVWGSGGHRYPVTIITSGQSGQHAIFQITVEDCGGYPLGGHCTAVSTTGYFANLRYKPSNDGKTMQYTLRNEFGSMWGEAVFIYPVNAAIEISARTTTLDDGYDALMRYNNPPMVIGKEYCTTEYWNGRAVYTRAEDMGNLPVSGVKNKNVGMNATNVIRVSGTQSSGTVLPFRHDGKYVDISANRNELLIDTNYDFSADTAIIQVWYTKD